MQNHGDLKRPLLYLAVGSVMVGAVLGIIVVLRNTWGWFEVRVILTTITIAIASLCGLACDLSKTARGPNPQRIGGLVLTAVAAGMVLLGMWSDLESEWYWKTTASVSILAIATVHVSLLAIARLARRFRWIFFIAWQVIYGLAALLCIMIIWEINNEQFFRLIATVSILDAAFTLSVPLLHRISRTDANRAAMLTPLEERNVDAIDQEISRLKREIADLEKLRSEIAGGAEESIQECAARGGDQSRG